MSLGEFWELIKFISQLFFVVALVIGLGIGCGYLLWVSGLMSVPTLIDPQDVYEAALNRYLSRETLTQSQCEGIALREAYPCR